MSDIVALYLTLLKCHARACIGDHGMPRHLMTCALQQASSRISSTHCSHCFIYVSSCHCAFRYSSLQAHILQMFFLHHMSQKPHLTLIFIQHSLPTSVFCNISSLFVFLSMLQNNIKILIILCWLMPLSNCFSTLFIVWWQCNMLSFVSTFLQVLLLFWVTLGVLKFLHKVKSM